MLQRLTSLLKETVGRQLILRLRSLASNLGSSSRKRAPPNYGVTFLLLVQKIMCPQKKECFGHREPFDASPLLFEL